MAQPTSAESTTASESDLERLEKHSISPATSFRNCREQINDIAAKMPRRSNLASRILDQDEDGAFHMDVHKRNPADLAKKVEREAALMDMLIKEKADDDVGSGAVVLDWDVPSQSNPAFAKYWVWQTQRAAPANSANTLTSSSQVLTSDIGLFALLPGELRNKIYILSLIEEDGVFKITGHPNQCSLGPCTHTKLPLTVPGLLSTCKQIRHEAMPIFLSENVFRFDAKTVRCRCTANYLRALGPYASFIDYVTLEVLVWTVNAPPPTLNHPVSARAGLMIQQPFEIRIQRPASIRRKFIVQIDNVIETRLKVEAELLSKHMEQLNKRAETEPMEQLLLEFVWSDRLADLIWKCEQNRAR